MIIILNLRSNVIIRVAYSYSPNLRLPRTRTCRINNRCDIPGVRAILRVLRGMRERGVSLFCRDSPADADDNHVILYPCNLQRLSARRLSIRVRMKAI